MASSECADVFLHITFAHMQRKVFFTAVGGVPFLKSPCWGSNELRCIRRIPSPEMANHCTSGHIPHMYACGFFMS